MSRTRKRAEVLAHIQNPNSQYHLPEIGKKLASTANRAGVAEWFPALAVPKSLAVDLALLGDYAPMLRALALPIGKAAQQHAPKTLSLLQTVPGIGTILSLVLLDESHASQQCPSVQDCVSSCRLVKWAKESAGNRYGTAGAQIGHAYLRWAYSEEAERFLRANPAGQQSLTRLENKHGQGKALTLLAQKLGRAVYYLLQRPNACDRHKLLHESEWVSLTPTWTCTGCASGECSAMRVSLRQCMPRSTQTRTPELSAVDGTPTPAPRYVAMVATGDVGCPSPKPEAHWRTANGQPPCCGGRYEGTEMLRGRRG
jgi:hypothetical protein